MEHVGGYELVHRFARGETADLYLARRHGAAGFVRDCVVKKLRADLQRDPAVVRRFLADARIAAQLQHRHIAQVIDLGRLQDQAHFAAIELVDGPDVGTLLDRAVGGARVPVDVAIWIVSRVAEAVHHAHEFADPVSGANLGLVHGHLSPRSVVVAMDGAVRTLGFSDLTAGARVTNLTQRQKLYAAPETRRGEPIARMADVFSLGAMLYHLLTGRAVPEQGPIPPPSSVEPRVDSELDALVAAALAAKPGDRQESAGRLGVAMMRWQLQRTGDARASVAAWMATQPATLSPRNRGFGEPPAADAVALDELPESALLDADVASHIDAPDLPMVGGDRALTRLRGHIEAGKRLICLRGMAGIGKSRIVQQAAVEHVDAGGVAWCVDLHEVADIAPACAAVMQATGGTLPGAGSDELAVGAAAERLATLGDGWLILDGLDMLSDRCGAMLSAWRDCNPDLRIIVTAQRRLDVPDATGMVVRPLAVPADDVVDVQIEACQLFVDRARRAAADWRPSRADAAAISAIARRLDGIPLAIEMAAARLAEMSLAQLAARLQTGLDVLSEKRGRRDTLRGAIGWSWTMLSGEERKALIELAVFVGGFTRATATAVLDAKATSVAGVTMTADEIIDDLRDRSMLRPISGEGDEQRFGMYESVRSYVEAQPDAPEIGRVASARHARTMIAMAAERAAAALTHDGEAAVDWLAAERENLLAVHRRALSTRPLTGARVTEALAVAAALYPAMIERGPQGVLHALFTAAIAAVDLLGSQEISRIDGPTRVHAEALHADMLGTRGNPSDGIAMAERALEHAASDDRAAAQAHYARAVCLRQGDRMHEAIDAATQARTICQRTGDAALEAQALNVIGAVFYDLGEREMSAGCFQAALAAARHVGHQLQVSRTTGNLGCIYADRGDMDKAAPYFHEALGDAKRLANRRGEGVIHSYLGIVAQERGNFGLAGVHYRRGLELLETVGDSHRKAYVEALYGWMLAETAELSGAEALLKGVVDEFVARGDWRLRAMYLATLAFIRACDGDVSTAHRLLGVAEKLASRQSDPIAAGTISVFRAGVLLADAESTGQQTDEAAKILSGVRAPRPADDTHPTGKPPLVQLSSEVRTALRILAANGIDSAAQPGLYAMTTGGAP